MEWWVHNGGESSWHWTSTLTTGRQAGTVVYDNPSVSLICETVTVVVIIIGSSRLGGRGGEGDGGEECSRVGRGGGGIRM